MSASVSLRPLTVDDASEIAALVQRNREFMAPWEPERDPEFFTLEWQTRNVADLVAEGEAGRTIPFVILDGDRIVGRITLNNVVRGPFQTAAVGYWVSEECNGRGVASAAVAALVPIAFGELGLHRLEAGTLVHNLRSQKVLLKNGFVEFGRAPAYLKIAGRWQEHVLFQLINEDM